MLFYGREITSICADFLVADAVPRNQSPSRGFPANRENNRESAREGEVEGAQYFEIMRDSIVISLRTKQGMLGKRTRKVLRLWHARMRPI